MVISTGDEKIPEKALLEWALARSESKGPEWIRDIARTIKAWYGHSEIVPIHTSGSTGPPKLIHLHKKEMIASARLTASRFGLQPGMKCLNCLPSRYIAGMMMIVRALVIKMDVYCTEPKIAPGIPSDVKIDFAAFTPMQLSASIQKNQQAINNIRTIIVGGAPVTNELLLQLQDIHANCFATYGMTETITHVAVSPLNGPGDPGIFEALDGVSFSEQSGNLCIHADHLKSPIFTRDVIELLDEFHFKWLGRSDFIINKGGIKINPLQIENVLRPAIHDRFIVSGITNKKSGQDLVLIIESDPYIDEKRELIEDRIQNLPKLQRPARVIFVPELLETKTGKIKRNADLYTESST